MPSIQIDRPIVMDLWIKAVEQAGLLNNINNLSLLDIENIKLIYITLYDEKFNGNIQQTSN